MERVVVVEGCFASRVDGDSGVVQVRFEQPWWVERDREKVKSPSPTSRILEEGVKGRGKGGSGFAD